MVLLAPKPDPFTPAITQLDRLGADLLAAQQRLALTPKTHAKQVGVTVTTLAGITSGTSDPKRSTITAALRWLARNR